MISRLQAYSAGMPCLCRTRKRPLKRVFHKEEDYVFFSRKWAISLGTFFHANGPYLGVQLEIGTWPDSQSLAARARFFTQMGHVVTLWWMSVGRGAEQCASSDRDGPHRPMFRPSLRCYFGKQFTLCLIFGGADASHDA